MALPPPRLALLPLRFALLAPRSLDWRAMLPFDGLKAALLLVAGFFAIFFWGALASRCCGFAAGRCAGFAAGFLATFLLSGRLRSTSRFFAGFLAASRLSGRFPPARFAGFPPLSPGRFRSRFTSPGLPLAESRSTGRLLRSLAYFFFACLFL